MVIGGGLSQSVSPAPMRNWGRFPGTQLQQNKPPNGQLTLSL